MHAMSPESRQSLPLRQAPKGTSLASWYSVIYTLLVFNIWYSLSYFSFAKAQSNDYFINSWESKIYWNVQRRFYLCFSKFFSSRYIIMRLKNKKLILIFEILSAKLLLFPISGLVEKDYLFMYYCLLNW